MENKKPKFEGPIVLGRILFDVVPVKCAWNITQTFYWPGRFKRVFRKGPGGRKTRIKKELSFKLN
jgi:hypothetical protein